MKYQFSRRVLAIVLGLSLFPGSVFAAETTPIVLGNTQKIQTNPEVFVNPWNSQKLLGVGQGGSILLMDSYQRADLPVSAPLYKLSEVYRDKIVQRDGTWGIERNLVRKVFDGTENWTLVTDARCRNGSSALFSTVLEKKAELQQGMCTHFTVEKNIKDRTNIFDGLTMEEDGTTYIRFMNVRGISTVEALQKYLSDQKNIQNAVTFLYPAEEPEFEPFPEDVQEALNKMDMSAASYGDAAMETKTDVPEAVYFQEGGGDAAVFGKAVTDIQIYNADKDAVFWISDVSADPEGCTVQMSYEKGKKTETLEGRFLWSDIDILSHKAKEILLKSSNENEGPWGILMMDFSRFQKPAKALHFLKEETKIPEECRVEKSLVLPAMIPVAEGFRQQIYFDNTIRNGRLMEGEEIKFQEKKPEGVREGNCFVYEPAGGQGTWEQKIAYGNAEQSIVWENVSKEAGSGQTRRVLFLGDSLLNENYYTKEVAKLFQEDSLKLELLGTRGEEGAKHEGRGGWSAYDYCREAKTYGVDNPFLNQGKFDFSYYMTQTKQEGVDDVFVNLGINDLNKLGHNSTEEILGYYQEIIRSVQSYNKNVTIYLGLPPVLFARDDTLPAKNARLNLIQALQEKFGNQEKIYFVPLYVGLDPYMDFKLTEPVLTEKMQDGRLIVSDATHPAISGYEKMARMTYSFLKYAVRQEGK